jgi:glycosyltransferase involved in cell wall biosynthesis
MIDRLSRGGTETQLLALIAHLDRRVVEPYLVLLDGRDEESQRLEPTNCPVLRLQLPSLKNPWKVARAARKLKRYWRRRQIDVVQTYFLDSTYFGVPLARACGIKHVLRVRNNVGHWLTAKHAALGRFVGRLAHRTLTNSQPGRLALWKAEGGNRKKLMVLENGVDLERFADIPPPRRPGVITIGTLANLRPVKGIDILVQAAQLLHDRYTHVRFVIAGEGSQRSELERMIQAARMSKRFHLLGQVSDVPQFLSTIDIAVLPSRAEGMANAVLEFMAAGRPVVATDVGANRHLLDQGRCGLLVPREDPMALADALARLIVDDDLARRLGQAGRERVVAHYSRDAMRQRFETFYQRLVA